MLSGLMMLAHVPAMFSGNVGRRLPLQSTAKLGSRFARSKVAMQQVAAPELVAKVITGETGNNVTPYIANLLGRDLCAPRPAPVPTCPPTRSCRAPPAPVSLRRSHRTTDHPLGIIKFKIEEYFNSLEGQNFEIVDNLEPFVNGKARVGSSDPHAHARTAADVRTTRHAMPRVVSRTCRRSASTTSSSRRTIPVGCPPTPTTSRVPEVRRSRAPRTG